VSPKVWDYVAKPKPDGYGAKHLLVLHEGFRVEVQVRTLQQHAWADMVEWVDRQFGARAKFGDAGADLHEALASLSVVIATNEGGAANGPAIMAGIYGVLKAATGMA
jgi:hypothetical protein